MSLPLEEDLRVRGCWPLPTGRRVAVVGARRPTPYGEAVAERLGGDLAQLGAVVLSGLALGIDGAAHRGALAGRGCTAAVLGTGLDVIYPRAHTGLAEQILAGGGSLISQFPDTTPPQRANFPRRNWTLAALSDVVVVVEAGLGSGALITAEAALGLGKPVLAVPGSVFSPLSLGCHQLLRDGAGLVQNARDVIAELGCHLAVLDDPLEPPARLGLERQMQRGRDPLLPHLSDTLPAQVGELAARLQVPLPEVMARLSRLELEGTVRRWGGGYVRLPAEIGRRPRVPR